jgi:DNA-binding IclR family transcriptional regulator
MTASEDSLTQGLRALTLLARRGPLDIGRVARINGWQIDRAAALVGVLQRAGLVRRLRGRGAFVVTPRAAALIGTGAPLH